MIVWYLDKMSRYLPLRLHIMFSNKETKQCSRCQEIKPVSDFYKNDGWIDGLHPYCKKCVLAYQKAAREAKVAQFPGKYRWKRDQVRHDYFARIDSPIKAYVLGVLAADGNVLPKHHRITLELSAKDADLLEMVRDQLVPGGAITTRSRRGFDYQTLAFVSHQMVEDLEALDITAAKSRTLEWPEKLPPFFAREFILGYFDGMGLLPITSVQTDDIPTSASHLAHSTCLPVLQMSSNSTQASGPVVPGVKVLQVDTLCVFLATRLSL